MQKLKRLLLAAMAAAGFALGACTPVSPHLDEHFGEALNLAKAKQTANPDASSNRDPVYGMDGVAAREAMVRYQKSFKDPEPVQKSFSIRINDGR